MIELHCGDSLDVMAGMEANSIDTIITDPPYGLSDGPTKYLGEGGRGGFMGKDWDHGIPGVAFWAEMLRVAKPGAMLLAFGGTRTYHRLACAIEDAGWEIRDCIMWVYGSGFPKSHDISKAIDKMAGAEREVIGTYQRPDGTTRDYEAWRSVQAGTFQREYQASQGYRPNGAPYAGEVNRVAMNITAPATDAARQWDGWGTALKPAWEPIILAMKPLDGTYAANALAWGCAGLAIDRARVGHSEPEKRTERSSDKFSGRYNSGKNGHYQNGDSLASPSPNGRWPSNLILQCLCEREDGTHDNPECPCAILDSQSGESKSSSGIGKPGTKTALGQGSGWNGHENRPRTYENYGDTGGASRFFAQVKPDEASRIFYASKASRRERNAGLEGMAERNQGGEHRARKTLPSCPEHDMGLQSGATQYPCGCDVAYGERRATQSTNHHPTVKPLALMRYLCRLTSTPTGGIVLDPFMGSGSTGCAAVLEGRSFVGIEKDADYLEIAKRRIEHAQAQMAHRQPSLLAAD